MITTDSMTTYHQAPRGYVLAGGRSRRMGRDKAFIPIDGLPMALRVARAMEPFCQRVAIVGKNPALARLGFPWVPDVRASFHPLVGVLSAMRDAPTDRILLAPCDLPHISSQQFASLLLHDEPVVADDEDGLHPLLALLPSSWSDRVALLLQQDAPAWKLVDGVKRVRLPASTLKNLNRAADMETT